MARGQLVQLIGGNTKGNSRTGLGITQRDPISGFTGENKEAKAKGRVISTQGRRRLKIEGKKRKRKRNEKTTTDWG